jgi:hypothetical protein
MLDIALTLSTCAPTCHAPCRVSSCRPAESPRARARCRDEGVSCTVQPALGFKKSRSLCQLPTAHKRDSQGICFIGKRDFPTFISSYIPFHGGDFIDEHGRFLATHTGHFQYTIGQSAALGGQPERLFVAAKDASTNRVLIVPVCLQPRRACPPPMSPSAVSHSSSSVVAIRFFIQSARV